LKVDLLAREGMSASHHPSFCMKN